MLNPALAYVVDELDVVEVNATTDPRDLVLPGVWITPEKVTRDTLAGGSTVTVAVIAIAASSSTPKAVADLDHLLASIATWSEAPATWQAATIRLPNHAAEPLPCLRGTIELTVTP